MQIQSRFLSHVKLADVTTVFDCLSNAGRSQSHLLLADYRGRVISLDGEFAKAERTSNTQIATIDDYIDRHFGNAVPEFAVITDTQDIGREGLAKLTRHRDKCIAVLIELPLNNQGPAVLPAAFSTLNGLGLECAGMSEVRHHPATGDATAVMALFVRSAARPRDTFRLYTSIPPTLKGASLEKQKAVIATWRAAGFEPITLNGTAEITDVINLGLDVEVQALATNGKPVIGEMLRIICQQDTGMAGLINADCAIVPYPAFAATIAEATRPDGMLFAQRIDHLDHKVLFNSSCWGFDAFFFDVAKAKHISDCRFKMGECWWDYWFPMTFAASGGRLSKIKYPVLLHEFHDAKWSAQNYMKYGNYFWDDFRGAELMSMPESMRCLAGLERTERNLGLLAMQTFDWLSARDEVSVPNLLPAEFKPFEHLLNIDRLVSAIRPEPAGDKRAKPKWRQDLRRMRKALKSSLGLG